MTKYFLPLCAALLLLPSAAFAAPAKTYINDEGAKVTDYGETRRIEITDEDTVEGEQLKPGGVNVTGRRATDLENMISVRGEFIPQLIALSNDI